MLNFLPILAAAAASLVLGAVWLAIAGAGLHRPALPLAFAALLAEFWLASILAGALILAPREAGEWVMAIGSAVVIWVGFVAPALVVTQMRRGMGAWAIVADCGYWLAAMVLQAVVLKGIGLVPPPGAPGA